MRSHTHLEAATMQMQAVIDRARIRDSDRMRAHKYALAVALIAPDVLADPTLADGHKSKVREILSECRALAVGSRSDEQPETFIAGIPVDDVLACIRSEVEKEIAARVAEGEEA